jgi:hypothetical protein
VTEFLSGLTAAGISIVILANPLVPLGTLIVLLAATLAIDGLRLLVTGGILRGWWRKVEEDLQSTWRWIQRVGRVGVGAVVVAIVLAVLVSPELRELTVLYLLAVGVIFLSVDRVAHATGRESASWLRGSSAGVGILALALVLIGIGYSTITLATFAILLAVSMLLGGVQSVLSGLRPTDPRQIVLLELVLFSLFYGLVLINWIDLFGKSVPAYGVWLVLTYFAPFWVLLVFEGYTEWPLALSLGLLVSLANDVGYYFVGNLLFGFHQNLGPWIAGQLGFKGTQLVTIFDAGAFSIPVDSWMMGLSIYVRAALVTVGLYYWWRHPGRIVARLRPGAPGAAVPSAPPEPGSGTP